MEYEDLTPEDMVVVDLEGNVVEGKYKPSSDTATHLELYKKYDQIGGVVHTHSTYAVALGPGWQRYSPLRNYPCGLFPRQHSLHEEI